MNCRCLLSRRRVVFGMRNAAAPGSSMIAAAANAVACGSDKRVGEGASGGANASSLASKARSMAVASSCRRAFFRSKLRVAQAVSSSTEQLERAQPRAALGAQRNPSRPRWSVVARRGSLSRGERLDGCPAWLRAHRLHRVIPCLRCGKIWCVRVVLAGDPAQREQCVPACIGEGGPEALRGCRFARRAHGHSDEIHSPDAWRRGPQAACAVTHRARYFFRSGPRRNASTRSVLSIFLRILILLRQEGSSRLNLSALRSASNTGI